MLYYIQKFNKGLAPKEATVFPNKYTIHMKLSEKLKKMIGQKVIAANNHGMRLTGKIEEVGDDYIVIVIKPKERVIQSLSTLNEMWIDRE